VPLHLQQAYARLGLKPGSFPNAEQAARECLSLPLYPDLPESQAKDVAAVIRKWLKEEG
jgi:dTDP-4-amino-4,6-dideoxygalactose transaminase